MRETNLTSLNGTIGPIEIAQRIDWENQESCMIVLKDKEGKYTIAISTQEPQDMLWCKELLTKYVDGILFG